MSDTWSLAKIVRKVEFKLLQLALQNCELKITNHKFYNFHLVADFGKLFSINPNTVRGRTAKIGSFMLRGSILYFFL